MTNATETNRRTAECPSWCVEDSDAGDGITIHHGPEISEYDRAFAAVPTSCSGGAPKDAMPGDLPHLEVRSFPDTLTPDEAIKIGAALIQLGERLKYDRSDVSWASHERANTAALKETCVRLAPTLARIDSDALQVAIDDRSVDVVGATLGDLMVSLGLTPEYGIGERLGRLVDEVVRDGVMTVGAWAAIRHCQGRPDLRDVDIQHALIAARCDAMFDAIGEAHDG
jgi:hypothetical protein